MGVVVIEGYGRYIPYFKSALDALYIDYAAWTAGEYKSFTEPYTRDDMSAEDREASRLYLDVLWTAYTQDVTQARGLSPVALDVLADNFVESLDLADGNAAALAINEGLVDELLTSREVEARLAEIAGEGTSGEGSYSGIDYASYLSAVRGADFASADERKVAVVTLAGEILDGVRAPGTIGGDSSAKLVRELRGDEDVRALVLRVDSPGGSAFASEVHSRRTEGVSGDGQAAGRINGQCCGIRRILDLDDGRRDFCEPDDDYRINWRGCAGADLSAGP